MTQQKQIALITGASRGIGKAIALDFAKNNIDVVLTGRNENDPGDIIIAIKKDNLEFKVKSFSGLVNFLNENTIPGDVIKLTVIRGNENLNLDVKLGFRPLIN